MAIKTKISAQSLVLSLYLGEDKKGKAIFKNLNLRGIKPNALDEDIHSIAKAVEKVLPYEVRGISKNTLTEIEDSLV